MLSATNHQRSSPRPSVSRNSYSDWTDFRGPHNFTERRIRAHIFLCVLGYLMENHLRQRLLEAGAPYSARAALEALEPLRVVTYDLPGVPVPIRACTRPTPEALAVASALGYTLPARLPLTAAA